VAISIFETRVNDNQITFSLNGFTTIKITFSLDVVLRQSNDFKFGRCFTTIKLL